MFHVSNKIKIWQCHPEYNHICQIDSINQAINRQMYRSMYIYIFSDIPTTTSTGQSSCEPGRESAGTSSTGRSDSPGG